MPLNRRRPLDQQFYSRFASSYDWSSQWNAIGAHMAMGIEGHGWSAIRWIWWWPLVWILWPLVWRVGIASWDRWNDGLCTAGTGCIWCGRTTFAAWGTRFVQLKMISIHGLVGFLQYSNIHLEKNIRNS